MIKILVNNISEYRYFIISILILIIIAILFILMIKDFSVIYLFIIGGFVFGLLYILATGNLNIY